MIYEIIYFFKYRCKKILILILIVNLLFLDLNSDGQLK